MATLFFVLPGLFVGARLPMSPAIYVSGGCGAIAAMGESWNSTRGSTRSVAMPVFLLVVAIFMLSSIGGTLSFSFNSQSYEAGLNLVGSRNILDAVGSELFGVGLIAMSISTFRCLVDRTQNLQGIFE